MGYRTSVETGQLESLFHIFTDLVIRVGVQKNTHWLVVNSLFSPIALQQFCFVMYTTVEWWSGDHSLHNSFDVYSRYIVLLDHFKNVWMRKKIKFFRSVLMWSPQTSNKFIPWHILCSPQSIITSYSSGMRTKIPQTRQVTPEGIIEIEFCSKIGQNVMHFTIPVIP